MNRKQIVTALRNANIAMHDCNMSDVMPEGENRKFYLSDGELMELYNSYCTGEKAKKDPIVTEKVELAYTDGEYSFFTKTVARLFIIALNILRVAGSIVTGKKASDLVSCLWVVHHMANKLEGIDSISSSVHDNCFCKMWRNIVDCICQYCYAHNQQSYQTGLKEHNILNGIILRNVLLPVAAFKKLVLIFPYLRIESFGDVANETQARNYIRIIKAFPGKRCAIWSKNLAIWKKAIEKEGKPANTTFVASSPYLNKPIAETILENFPFIDHIFTVFTKQYAKKHNITINCGGRKCLECIKQKTGCYFKNNILYINELKK